MRGQDRQGGHHRRRPWRQPTMMPTAIVRYEDLIAMGEPVMPPEPEETTPPS